MDDRRISRRQLLAAVGLIGSMSGCTGFLEEDTGSTPTDAPTPTGTPTVTESTPTPQPEETDESTTTLTEEPSDQPETQFESFVGVDGVQLTIDSQPVHFFGTRPTNIIDLTHPVEWVEEMFQVMAQNGYTLARVHAFQPFWGDESKQPQPGEVSEPVMQRLDRIIQAARTRGIRLSLMLINAKPAIHNADTLDDNYGVNAHTYANHAESVTEYDEFYANPECKELYKQRVETVLTRENSLTGVEYRNEPAIAIWELGNEIEYEEPWKHDDPTLRPWIEEMSTYIKSIDENHLVTTGEYGWAGRNNYVADHQPDSIDLCSIHYYPGPRSYDLPNDPERDHPGLLGTLIETAHQELAKPVYLGEYNWKVETGADPPLTERNEQLRRIHRVPETTEIAAATYHELALSKQQDWPRGGATTFGDTDDGSMAEFRRMAEIQYEKSADGALPQLPPVE